MTSLELYKFVNKNKLEFRYQHNHELSSRDLMLFVEMYLVNDFNKLLSSSIYDDGGISCTMKDGYMAIWMYDICEYHDILLEEVFGEDKETA